MSDDRRIVIDYDRDEMLSPADFIARDV